MAQNSNIIGSQIQVRLETVMNVRLLKYFPLIDLNTKITKPPEKSANNETLWECVYYLLAVVF